MYVISKSKSHQYLHKVGQTEKNKGSEVLMTKHNREG